MKKTIFTILICGFWVLGVTGCNNSEKKDDNDIHTFKGTIIECEQKSMIVQPNESEEEFKSSDKFRIEYVDGFNSCNVGDKVKITYIGGINESYPAQIGTTNVEKIDKKQNYSKTIDNVTLSMNIPNGWQYEELSQDDSYKYALKLYKSQDNKNVILYFYNNPFGVCGTGRTTEKIKLKNGEEAIIGYYSDKEWNDISFYDLNQYIAFINYGLENDEATEFLDFVKTITIE